MRYRAQTGLPGVPVLVDRLSPQPRHPDRDQPSAVRGHDGPARRGAERPAGGAAHDRRHGRTLRVTADQAHDRGSKLAIFAADDPRSWNHYAVAAYSGMLACAPRRWGASAIAEAMAAAVWAGEMISSTTPSSSARPRPPIVASCSAASAVSASCSLSAGTAASLRLCRMRIAGTEPITATSAPGQANTLVAPSDREFIAM